MGEPNVASSGEVFEVGEVPLRAGVYTGVRTATPTSGAEGDGMRTIAVALDALQDPLIADYLMEFAEQAADPHPMQYDQVIRCTGWQHDTAVYSENVAPLMQRNGKYPAMTAEYESQNVPGLYFAGTLSHGRDHKRAAGGFIHGFRYTARALFKMLEVKYQHQTEQLQPTTAGASSSSSSPPVQWPGALRFSNVAVWDGETVGLGGIGCIAAPLSGSAGCEQEVPPLSGFAAVLDQLFSRIDTASGPYQMVGVLADGLVLRCPTGASAGAGAGGLEAEYLPEVGLDYFNQKYDMLPRIAWHFGYGEQRQALHQSMQHGTTFRVHVWWYAGDCKAQATPHPTNNISRVPRAKSTIMLAESVHTRWGRHANRRLVGKWLHQHIARLQHPDQRTTDSAGDADAEVAWVNSTKQPQGGGGGGGGGRGGGGAEGVSNAASQVWHGTGVVDMHLFNRGTEALIFQEYESRHGRK
jgi:hypothetical protein